MHTIHEPSLPLTSAVRGREREGRVGVGGNVKKGWGVREHEGRVGWEGKVGTCHFLEVD